MNYRSTLIAAAIAAIVPLASTAVANDDSKMSGKSGASFDSLDTDRDGRISRTEAASDSSIAFTRADTNGDGYIDSMEYKRAQKSMGSDSDDSSAPQPHSYPNDASGQQTEPVSPTDPSATEPTTPPTDTETPRQ